MARPTDPVEADDLLLLAVSDPEGALVRAAAILDSDPDAWWTAVGRQVTGLAWRQSGDLDRALPDLRAAVRAAEASGDPDRVADVRATLGVTLAMAGRTIAGLEQLDRGVAQVVDQGVAAKVRMRRGYVLSAIVGRHREALADYDWSLAAIRSAGDRVWEARTLNNMSVLHLLLGEPEPAETLVVAAERIFAEEGQPVEAAQARHNRGYVAFCRGDLPVALRLYDEAAARFAQLSMNTVQLTLDRVKALMTAGLPIEAAEVARDELARDGLQPIEVADLRLSLATALLAGGAAVDARHHAREARIAYRRQRRDWFGRRAELVELRARAAAGPADRGAAEQAREIARLLEAEPAEEAVHAWLLAARLSPAEPIMALRAAAAYRSRGVPLVRATGWLAQGLEREVRGDRRGVLAACRRGLDELDRHRSTLGSSELRALASRHGADLADLALRAAVDGPPRRLLGWSERWRATSLTQPRVRPGERVVAGPVVALRDNARRLREAREQGDDVGLLETERRRLENTLRSRLHQTAGTEAGEGTAMTVGGLVDAVGDGSFIELVEIGGTLHALVVSRGRVRRHEVGPVGAADQAVVATAFALRQAARGRPARLAEAGARLERALLGPAARRLPGPVVLSPTSRLHGVPWGLLPALADVPHSVVPSAALWLRARERGSVSDRRVFVSGPGLTTGGAEISVVAPRHADAIVLRDGAATVDDAMGALDGAGIAHLAAHGHFRADSPLFSSLDLADGPLAVHDFERLDRAPHRVVLSACDSGVLAPVGAGELLGLVSALLAIGTAGVVASVAVVNDEATVDVMVDVHAALDDGADLATALHSARTAAADDPTRVATAAAFLALGV